METLGEHPGCFQSQAGTQLTWLLHTFRWSVFEDVASGTSASGASLRAREEDTRGGRKALLGRACGARFYPGAVSSGSAFIKMLVSHFLFFEKATLTFSSQLLWSLGSPLSCSSPARVLSCLLI